MMEGNRDLNQSLQELLFFRRRRSPNVFPDLVRVEEAGAVEQVESVKVGRLFHYSRLPSV
jgi:hypothetical protein